MSHPSADPAVVAASALLSGLATADAGSCRVLEIGCGSGHHLIPLALRWPQSTFTGLDFSSAHIASAQELARISGARNLSFHHADLRDFCPEDFPPESGPFDYIIAHGFLSWVPDDVKRALFAFIRQHLAANGVAVVSFNVATGWEKRFPVIGKTRAIQQAGGVGEMRALTLLAEVSEDPTELAIIRDMLAKGPEILPFDDFAPVNDPWSLSRFLQTAGAAGLRFLGESDASENFPAGITRAARKDISARFRSDPDALDRAAGRTFRSALLCREEAVLRRISPEEIRSFHLRWKQPARAGIPENPAEIFRAIEDGLLQARIEKPCFDLRMPDFPMLGAFRLECARRHLPLVDAWHRPCVFPPEQRRVLALMDGRKSLAELGRAAAEIAPRLAFRPWIAHLAGRGMFG